MAFKIKGYEIKDKQSYLKSTKREKVTTTIEENRLNEYKKLMDALGREYCVGYDMLIDLLEDQEILNKFIEKVRAI